MVVLNPATHTRNILSNMVMSDLAGMNPLTSSSARKAWKGSLGEAWRQDGKWWRLAVEDGLVGTDFVSAELRREMQHLIKDVPDLQWSKFRGGEIEASMQLADFVVNEIGGRMVKGTRKAYRFVPDHAAALYQFEENAFKITRYKQVWSIWEEMQKTGKITRDMKRALGGSEAAIELSKMSKEGMRAFARKESNKWFFDYGDVSRAVEWAKNGWSPFVTFQYKAIPRVFEWMHSNPVKAFMYRRTFESLNWMTEFMDGTPPDPETYRERELERNSLPGYAKMATMRMPGSRDYEYSGLGSIEQARYLDLQHYTPMGSLLTPTLDFQTDLWPDVLEPRHPLLTGVAGPLIFNRPEYNPESGRVNPPFIGGYWDRVKAKAKVVGRNMLPPLFPYHNPVTAPLMPLIAPNWQGRSLDKLKSSLSGRPYPDVPEGRIDRFEDALRDAMFGYRYFSVDIGDDHQLYKMYDNKLRALDRWFAEEMEKHDALKSKARQREIEAEYDAKFDEIDEWLTGVEREASLEASMRGRAMGDFTDNPHEIAPWPLKKDWRRDRFLRMINRYSK